MMNEKEKIISAPENQKKINFKNIELGGTNMAGSIRSKVKHIDQIFIWHGLVNKQIRSMKSGISQKKLLSLMETYIKLLKTNKESFIGNANRCSILAKAMCNSMFLFKELNRTSTESQEYLLKMCELLSFYTFLELKFSSKFNSPKVIIAERILTNYDIHLKGLDFFYTLRVFLNIPSLFNQKEVMSKIFQKYLKMPTNCMKREMPDKLYCMYLVVFNQWMSLESDNFEKNKICDYANQYMKPMESLCSNKTYAPFLPVYVSNNPDVTKCILSDGFNSSHLIRVLKRDEFTKEVIIDLSENEPSDKPLILDKEDWSKINLEPLDQDSTIKLEVPQTVAIIDLTIETSTSWEIIWLNELLRKSRASLPTCFSNLARKNLVISPEIINIDDDEEENENDNVNNINDISNLAINSNDVDRENVSMSSTTEISSELKVKTNSVINIEVNANNEHPQSTVTNEQLVETLNDKSSLPKSKKKINPEIKKNCPNEENSKSFDEYFSEKSYLFNDDIFSENNIDLKKKSTCAITEKSKNTTLIESENTTQQKLIEKKKLYLNAKDPLDENEPQDKCICSRLIKPLKTYERKKNNRENVVFRILSDKKLVPPIENVDNQKYNTIFSTSNNLFKKKLFRNNNKNTHPTKLVINQETENVNETEISSPPVESFSKSDADELVHLIDKNTKKSSMLLSPCLTNRKDILDSRENLTNSLNKTLEISTPVRKVQFAELPEKHKSLSTHFSPKTNQQMEKIHPNEENRLQSTTSINTIPIETSENFNQQNSHVRNSFINMENSIQSTQNIVSSPKCGFLPTVSATIGSLFLMKFPQPTFRKTGNLNNINSKQKKTVNKNVLNTAGVGTTENGLNYGCNHRDNKKLITNEYHRKPLSDFDKYLEKLKEKRNKLTPSQTKINNKIKKNKKISEIIHLKYYDDIKLRSDCFVQLIKLNFIENNLTTGTRKKTPYVRIKRLKFSKNISSISATPTIIGSNDSQPNPIIVNPTQDLVILQQKPQNNQNDTLPTNLESNDIDVNYILNNEIIEDIGDVSNEIEEESILLYEKKLNKTNNRAKDSKVIKYEENIKNLLKAISQDVNNKSNTINEPVKNETVENETKRIAENEVSSTQDRDDISDESKVSSSQDISLKEIPISVQNNVIDTSNRTVPKQIRKRKLSIDSCNMSLLKLRHQLLNRKQEYCFNGATTTTTTTTTNSNVSTTTTAEIFKKKKGRPRSVNKIQDNSVKTESITTNSISERVTIFLDT